eukprot:3935584-Rhodomonas_salina.2
MLNLLPKRRRFNRLPIPMVFQEMGILGMSACPNYGQAWNSTSLECDQLPIRRSIDVPRES